MKAKSDAPLTTPRIDEVLTQFRKRGGKPTAENQENDQRIKKLEQQVSHLIQKVHCVNIDYYISVISITYQYLKKKKDLAIYFYE